MIRVRCESFARLLTHGGAALAINKFVHREESGDLKAFSDRIIKGWPLNSGLFFIKLFLFQVMYQLHHFFHVGLEIFLLNVQMDNFFLVPHFSGVIS